MKAGRLHRLEMFFYQFYDILIYSINMSYKIGAVYAINGCNNYKQQDSNSFFRMPKDKDV